MKVHCDLLGWFALAHLLVVLPVVELPCWTYKSVVATPSLLHPSRLLDSIDDGGSVVVPLDGAMAIAPVKSSACLHVMAGMIHLRRP
jgi:hypothetical protein